MGKSLAGFFAKAIICILLLSSKDGSFTLFLTGALMSSKISSPLSSLSCHRFSHTLSETSG